MTPPSPTQWLIILAIVLLLFGATRLPKLAKSLGESARIFKSEVRNMRDEDKPHNSDAEKPTVEGRVIDPTTREESRRSEPEAEGYRQPEANGAEREDRR